MKINYIFIIGVQKGGTTALAGWLVRNGFAAYAVPGVKEPGVYLRHGIGAPLPAPRGDMPLIDASTAYFANQKVISRLPEHRIRIALCLRNPLERAWSAYRMMKLVTQQGDGASEYLQRFHAAAGTPQALERAAWYEARRDVVTQAFPRRAVRIVERYFDEEAARLAAGTFLQRLEYELAFYMSRGEYPFFSVLNYSFYHQGVRMLLDKYQPEDVVVVTMNRTSDPGNRGQLVKRLCGRDEAGPDLGVAFTLDDVPFDEPSPDLSAPDFAHFRRMFAYDVDATLKLLDGRRCSTSLVDRAELYRHIA